MRLSTRVLAFLLVVCTASSCQQERRFGDADGRPVQITVHLERGFVRAMSNRQWTPSGTAVVTSDAAGGTNVVSGIGFTFSTTSVYLYGGTSIAAADVFLHRLSWGDNDFTVPLTPGRTLDLTVKAEGGREGWEALSPVRIPQAPDARIVIRLTATQEQVTVAPSAAAAPAAPAAVLPAASASAAPAQAPATAGAAAAPQAASAGTDLGSPTPRRDSGSTMPAASQLPAADAPAAAGSAAPDAAPAAIAPAAPASTDTPLIPVAPGIAVEASASPQATRAPEAGAATPGTKIPQIFAPPVPAVSPAAPYPDPALQDK